jgi:mannosyl-oligosaccharide alpha-1,2-mannosidase
MLSSNEGAWNADLAIGYDLLKGPWSDLVSDSSKVDKLLEQAAILADSLSIAFDTPSGVPDTTIILNPEPRRKGSENNGIAGIGTLVLEWTRLGDLTGNTTYAELVKKAQGYLVDPTGVPEPFPGLVGEGVSLETGEFIDDDGGWGAGTDSFYEYLIKMYLYDPEEFASYKDRWVLAADSTIEHLASHPTSREDLTFLLQFNGKTLTPSSGHCKLALSPPHLNRFPDTETISQW